MARKKAMKWSDVRDKHFTKDEQQRLRSEAEAELEEMRTLASLRKQLELTQGDVANLMNVSQPRVAAMEKAVDQRVSTLRRYIEALGGTLELTGVFWDEEQNREVRIPLAEVEALTR